MISDRLFRYLCDSKLFPLSDSWFLSLFHQRSYFLFFNYYYSYYLCCSQAVAFLTTTLLLLL